MKKDDKNFDFDLDFLDEASSGKKKVETDTPQKESRPFLSYHAKDRLKLWGTALAVLVGIIFIGVLFDDSSSSSSASTNTNTNYLNDTVVVGEYRCSRYDYNRAVELDPETADPTLTSDQILLESRGNEVDRLGNEIEASYVNEYSPQWEIDAYNAKVNEYNSKLASYNRDVTSIQARIDRYNTQVEIHNNYLIQNCTLNR